MAYLWRSPAARDLRVAMVLGTSTGGIGRHVHSLVRGLTGHGVRVRVYSPEATEARFDFTGAGARVTSLEIPASPGRLDLRGWPALRQVLRADPGDGEEAHVVHAHGLRAGLLASWARPATPLVVTWHNRVLDSGVRGAALGLAERIVARAADVTLGASDDLVARAIGCGGVDVRLGPVAAPALTEPVRAAADVLRELDAPGRPLVLSVGRLHPQKGYHTLVEAAARWRGLTPVPMVAIAGAGPSYRALAGKILTDRAPVTLLGHRDDVPDLLGAATVAVLTSVWEARALFAQEALAAGVPLVATDVGGLRELVGDAATLVPYGDIDALDAAVRALLADPDLRARYGEAGRARAALLPDERETVDQVGSLYVELSQRATVVGPSP